MSSRTLIGILAAGAACYLATRIAWLLTFPGSQVSLFYPPHAVLVSILLLVPTRHWWAYLLSGAAAHFIATQLDQWPMALALQSEAFDALKAVLTAAGIRLFIKSPLHLVSLREALLFVLIAVILVPFGISLWVAPDWTAWRELGISNAVTTIVLVPVILIGVHLFRTGIKATGARIFEAFLLAACIAAVAWFAPEIFYMFIPLLIWAALRFGLGGMSASVLLITLMLMWGAAPGMSLQLFILFAGTPLLLLAVAIDDERRSKEALRVSEQRMNLAAESAQLALWDWDLTSDVVWVQDQGLFGFPPDAPVDHATLGGSVHPDDEAVREAAIQRALENGGHYESEFRVILADGSVRWIAARGRSPTPGSGKPERILGIAIDITRQKKGAEEAQLQREELAHLSRVATMSALSGSLAHELNQPLTSILGNTHAGQSIVSKDEPDVAELREIFADIDSSASRAGEIIERLRTLLRRGHVALQPVDVKENLEELLRLTRTDLIARGVSVSNLSTGDLPAAMADRVQLQQILLNLIHNACDAMQLNPPEDRRITLTTAVEQNELRIGVLDCGIGLPDDVESLFQPFHSTKEGGLGMGLSICRTLVSAHGGRLWAEKRPGRGAAFYVALPLAAR